MRKLIYISLLTILVITSNCNAKPLPQVATGVFFTLLEHLIDTANAINDTTNSTIKATQTKKWSAANIIAILSAPAALLLLAILCKKIGNKISGVPYLPLDDQPCSSKISEDEELALGATNSILPRIDETNINLQERNYSSSSDDTEGGLPSTLKELRRQKKGKGPVKKNKTEKT